MAEKSLNDLPRDLRAMHTRGRDAMMRDNFDYAIDLLMQVLSREPAVFECRKDLRITQAKKAGKGSGFFKKMLNSASFGPMLGKGQIALHTNPAEALHVAEQILNVDPSNLGAHKLIVDASTTLGLPRTCAMSLEILSRSLPKDRDIAMHFAEKLAEIGEVNRAENVLAEACRQYPQDNEMLQALKNLSARKTLDEGGYEALSDGSGSYRDILKDKEEAVSLEQESRQNKSEDVAARLISEYETRLRSDPSNIKLLRSLAELQTQKKQYDKALGYYDRIKATDVGNDPSLDRDIAETVTRKFDDQIATLDPNGDDYQDRLAQLHAEKQNYRLTECQRRADRFPTDLGIRFELAKLYFDAGKITEATQEFQKAQNNPHKRIASMNYLAQCFAKRKMYDLAAKRLQDALKEKPAFDEEKKELIYNLGSVLEAMGKQAEAIEQYKLIYEADVGYKDVAKKVEDFYSSQG